MQLLRAKVREMLSFVTPALLPDDCIHVRIDEGKMIIIVKGKNILKKVILPDQSNKDSSGLPETFMIPGRDLARFKEGLKEDAAVCKTLEKDNHTRLYVEMDNKELFSHKSKDVYEQPLSQYEEFGHYFEQSKSPISESIILTGELGDLLKGFSGTKIVNVSYCDMTVGKEQLKLVHYNQEETGLEAVYICPAEVNGKQTSY